MNLTQIKDKIAKIKIKLPNIPKIDKQLAKSFKIATMLTIPLVLAVSVNAQDLKTDATSVKLVTAMPYKLEDNIFKSKVTGKVEIVVGESEAQRKEREEQEKAQRVTVAKYSNANTFTIAAARPQEEIKAIAFDLVCSRWDTSQWEPFDYIIGRESGWNWQARNKSTGAYGLGQAYPASKMGDLGSTPEGQVQWVVAYIANRYGSPSSAHQFWVTHGWY